MGFFNVEEQRARHRVGAVGNSVEGGLHAVHERPLDRIGVLVQEAEPEDAKGIWVGIQFLYDQIVVFTGFHIAAVFTNCVGGRLEVVLVHGLDKREPFGSLFHHQLYKSIPGAGGGRWPQDFDFRSRKRVVDIFPGIVRVGDQFFSSGRIGNVLGQGQEDVLSGQFERAGFLGIGDNNAVIANLDLDDFLDAVGLALVVFRFFHGPGGIGDVRVFDSHAGAEKFEAAARSGGFDLGGFETRGFPELLGHDGGKRVDRGRSDDADVVAGGCRIRASGRRHEKGGGGQQN